MASAIELEDFRGADVARVASVLCASGARVEAHQALFEIENHKAVQEIESPRAGVLVHALRGGADLKLGVPIAFVADDGEDLAALEAQAKAALLPSPAPAADRPRGEPVDLRKATEIAVLSQGAGASMLSTLGAAIGPVARAASTPDFFSNKILDLIVYEASRLLAGEYKALNAYFEDGAVVSRDAVHAGVGFDDGKRLTLYVVEDAQTLSLADTQDEIVGGLMRYVGRALTPEQVSRATFTVSDLSASQLIFSFPLLPRDQCIIIAVTKSEAGDYSLFISFDHRVSEGMTVAAFATELVARLRSFGEAAAAEALAATPEPECAFCGRSLHDEVTDIGGKGLLKIVDAQAKDAFCCAGCWAGW